MKKTSRNSNKRSTNKGLKKHPQHTSKRDVSLSQLVRGRSVAPRAPLNLTYPGVSLPRRVQSSSGPSESHGTSNGNIHSTRSLRLNNGIRYGSILDEPSSLGGVNISMAIAVGGRNEAPAVRGITNFLTHSLLHSSKENRHGSTFHRDMNKLGVHMDITSTREHLNISISAPPLQPPPQTYRASGVFGNKISIKQHHYSQDEIDDAVYKRTRPVIGLLADMIHNTQFDEYELAVQQHQYRDTVHRFHSHDNYSQLSEILHKAAFGHSPLGNPLYPATADHITTAFTSKNLDDWRNLFFTADKISIASSHQDLSHGTLVGLMNEFFHKIPRRSTFIDAQKNVPSAYVGKTLHIEPDANLPIHLRREGHVGIAFNAPSAIHEDAIAANILHMALSQGTIYAHPIPTTRQSLFTQSAIHADGYSGAQRMTGGMFYTPGTITSFHPSSSSQSSLKRIMNAYHLDWVKNIDTFYHEFTDAGLFGFHAVLSPTMSARQQFIDQMARLTGQLSAGQLDDHTIENARQRYIANMSAILQSKTLQTSHVALQLAIHGQDHTARDIELAKTIEPDRIRHVAQQIFSSPMTVASYGSFRH